MRPAREPRAVLAVGRVLQKNLCRRKPPQAFARALARHYAQTTKEAQRQNVAPLLIIVA